MISDDIVMGYVFDGGRSTCGWTSDMMCVSVGVRVICELCWRVCLCGVRVVCELCWSEVVMDRVGCSTCGRASNLLGGLIVDDEIFDTTTSPPSRRDRRTRRTDKNGEYSVTSRGILVHDREVVV